MDIIVDTRETDLLFQLRSLVTNIPSYNNIRIKVETLNIGDIIISINGDEKLILERKSINDLNSSIKDGRYEEQSYRLNGLKHHNHNIIYLIEGDINKMNRFKDNKVEKMTLYSAIFSLNYYKGFSVIRTFNLEETAIFICNTTYKLNKGIIENRQPYYKSQVQEPKIETNVYNIETEILNDVSSNHVISENKETTQIAEQSENDYVNVVKKVKKENVTRDNIGAIMLSQIPGISSVTAIAIMDKFKTIQNLIDCIRENQNCLDDITYNTSKDQKRKINKTSINNLKEYLVPNND
jgi:ERCC4-type nuclease